MTVRSKRLLLALSLVAVLFVIPGVALMSLRPAAPQIARSTAIVLEVSGEMLEYHPAFAPGALFGRRELTLTDALACLDAAAKDARVTGIVLRIYPSGAGAAKCQELARAVGRFRASGRRAVAFSPILYGHHYLVASAADSLFMPPSGYLVVPGPASSATYLRGAFDKLGIKPNIHRIERYKSAAETYTETGRSPESREMAGWLLADLYEGFVEDAAAARGVGADTVRRWIDRGLYSPASALESGLIDGIRHWDEIEAIFEERGDVLLDAADYLRAKRAAAPFAGPRVAVIHAQGVIEAGENGFSPVSGEVMGARTIAAELRRAREDGAVKAVVLRIDSPGGDGIAGDLVSREVELTSLEKPVVVSMSDVAASGGYEIAYRADRIVALPATFTGSIGSITGKLNLRGLYDKLGIAKDEIGTAPNSLIYSDYRDFSEEERRLVEEEHWRFYRGWIEEIARFREMPVDSIDGLARGRVWTGSQAVSNGLVDEIGDLSRAVEVACGLAGIDSSRVALVHYPRRTTLFQQMLSRNLLEEAAARVLRRAIFDDARTRGGLFIRHEAPAELLR
jgi:protease-4